MIRQTSKPQINFESTSKWAASSVRTCITINAESTDQLDPTSLTVQTVIKFIGSPSFIVGTLPWSGVNMTSIDAIKSRYYSIAGKLAAPAAHVHFAKTPQHDGSPHVESRRDNYYYVVTERGEELERRPTRDPDELLYWLVSDLASGMALDYELRHRIPGQDFRRLYFKTSVELLRKVNCDWSERQRVEYDKILVQHPFQDV